MYKIDDEIYQGGRPTSNDWEIFNADWSRGHWAIICLEEEKPERDVPYLITVHIPIIDGPFPGINWLRSVIKIIDALCEMNKNIYIHCRGGYSRSVMVTAAYLMKKYHWSVDKAMETIALSNPTLDPSPSFMRGLKEWYLSLA
jgi:atypical dual specificity phosphatase